MSQAFAADIAPAAIGLADYACLPSQSRGRRFTEPEAPTRNLFQRDRDRIVHSTAFRRLVYKTQVFLNQNPRLTYRPTQNKSVIKSSEA